MNRFVSILALFLLPAMAFAQAKKIPVILDTDIGDDIDDTWALVMALKSPEIDLKMVVTDYGNATYRGRIIARILEVAKRTDIPVGLGVNNADKPGRQSKWIEGYDLAKYPGKVHADGVQAMIDMVMNSPEPITLLCIGPVPNIGEALKREPKIAQKARFVGMHGSVRVGYGGSKTPSAEWNVKADARACQATLAAPWVDTIITPLDTCGLIRLAGDKYAKVRDCKDPLTVALIENYKAWVSSDKKNNADKGSTTLFDCVAVYLAMTTDLCKIEKLPIVVNEKGMTLIDEKAGRPMNVATEWKDLKAFEDYLVERLTK